MPNPLWTIRDVLVWTQNRFARAGLATPRLDAEVLLAHALGCDRVTLYTDHHRPLSAAERARYRALVADRLAHKPVAHLVGHREFWSRRFRVSPDVLIPRPETETLVEVALTHLREFARPRLLDVGTGSGAIAVTLAAECPEATVVATDVSEAALQIAEQNARTHGVSIQFHAGDLLSALPPDTAPFHVIVANLPYVSPEDRATLAPEVLAEPSEALFADREGLALIERLVTETTAGALRPGGWLVLEVGAGQAARVCEGLEAAGYGAIAAHRDLADVDRVVAAQWPGTKPPPARRPAPPQPEKEEQ